MNLESFESDVDYRIFVRGREYYAAGRVRSLVPTSADAGVEAYEAMVIGREPYAVRVRLTPDGEVAESTCECAYARGMYCKHQIAVLHALRDARAPQESP